MLVYVYRVGDGFTASLSWRRKDGQMYLHKQSWGKTRNEATDRLFGRV